MSNILHLSDLHFGDAPDKDVLVDSKRPVVPLSARMARKHVLENTLRQLAIKLKKDGIPLDALVISGDLTYGYAEKGFVEFTRVFEWLGDICPPKERIVIIPGNHDVKRGAATAAEKYEYFLKYVRAPGYVTPLLDEIDVQSNGAMVSNLAPHYVLDPDLRWAIIPINSSHRSGSINPVSPISETVWQTLPAAVHTADPSVAADAASKVLSELRDADMARLDLTQIFAVHALREKIHSLAAIKGHSPLLIGVMHHQLLPVTDREEIKPYETVTNLGQVRSVLRDNDFSVILHGHKHEEFKYFDYIHRRTESDLDAPHRVFVISAPSIKDGDPYKTIIGRLIRTPPERLARTIQLQDISPVMPGASLTALPKSQTVRIWQPNADGPFKDVPFQLVEGRTIDETYERAVKMFDVAGQPLLSNLVCRVSGANDPVSLPESYPVIPNHSTAADRTAWFNRLVTWWQKDVFNHLKYEHFTHGKRIARNGQLERVVKAIKNDPLTSRAVMSLFNPEIDCIDNLDSRFPSFTFVQFVVRNLRPSRYSLEVVAYFRKQEIKHWWPVNLAELARLQAKVYADVRETVEKRQRGTVLDLGPITTIATIAEIKEEIPQILVPAVDIAFEEGPEKLWEMIYALCFVDMKDRVSHGDQWRKVLSALTPPETPDSTGVPVGVQAVRRIQEDVRNFARHHPEKLSVVLEQLGQLVQLNEQHAGRKEEDARRDHSKWRSNVVAILNRIRGEVNRELGISLAEIK